MANSRTYGQTQMSSPLLARLLGHEELDAFYQVAEFHGARLRPLRNDLVAQARGNLKPIHALDFQELYCYMYPFSNRASDSALVRYYLDNSQTPFFLPDGTVYELTMHLERLARDIGSIGEVMRDESSLQSSLSQLKLLSKSGSRDILGPIREDLQDFYKPMNLLSRYLKSQSTAVERLFRVLGRKEHLGISALYSDRATFTVDEDAFTTSKRILDAIRPQAKDSNLADALNIASIVQMRNHPPSGHFNPFLVTHTPSLLYSSVWLRDQEAQLSGITGDLFKTHVDVFYATVVAKHSPELEGQVRLVDTALEKCSQLQQAILDVPGFLAPAEKSPKRRLEDVWELTESWAQKQELQGALQQFQDYFLNVFAKTIDSQMALNERSNITAAEISGGSGLPLDRERLSAFRTIEKLRGEIQSIMDLSRRKAGTEPRTVKAEQSSSRVFPVLNLFSLTRDEGTSKYTDTDWLRLLNHDGDLIAGIEKYKLGHFSLYWRTLTTLNEFIQCVNDTIHRCRQWAESEQPESQFDDQLNPKFRETILVSTNRMQHQAKLRHPLDLDQIRSQLKQDEVIQFIKVNTNFGSIYIDVFISSQKSYPMMGIVTHLAYTKIWVDVLEQTSQQHIWSEYLQIEIDRKLGKLVSS